MERQARLASEFAGVIYVNVSQKGVAASNK